MSPARITHALGALTLLTLLQGCQMFAGPDECCETAGPVADPEGAWLIHQRQVGELDHWQIDGKLGVRTEQESGSLRLQWLQQQDQYRIRASDPIGRQLALLNGSEQGVVLTQGDQQLFAQSPEALLAAQLGWPLPVSDLLYWVRGLPAPGNTEALGLNEMGQLNLLAQHGWQLTFDQYRALGHYPPLPTRISAKHPALGLQLRLLIYNWQVEP